MPKAVLSWSLEDGPMLLPPLHSVAVVDLSTITNPMCLKAAVAARSALSLRVPLPPKQHEFVNC
jgi:hypothetical protein